MTKQENMPLTSVEIVMVGPTGVGKSSLLGAMSEQLKDSLTKLGYVASIPDELFRDLKRQLEEISNSPGAFIADALQLEGTRESVRYDVNVRQRDAKFDDLGITFVDVPGGWYSVNSPDRPKVEELLSKTCVSFWCVDAVSMMYNEGKTHETTNNPKLIAELYRNKSLHEEHTIVFVLMRSETWVKKDVASLYRTFRSMYDEYITEIRHAHTKVKFYCCYVETLGNVTFVRYAPDGKTEFVHHMKDPHSPSNCDCPALIAIHDSLENALKQMKPKTFLEQCKCLPFVSMLFGPKYREHGEVTKRLKQLLQEVEVKIKNRLDDGNKVRQL